MRPPPPPSQQPFISGDVQRSPQSSHIILLHIFIDFTSIAAALPPTHIHGAWMLLHAAAASMVMSNAPATIYLSSATSELRPLAIGVNIGGVTQATGSPTNIIVVYLTGMRWSTMHRYMLPYGVASLAPALAMHCADI